MSAVRDEGPIDPWPFSVSEGSANELLDSMLKGRKLLILPPGSVATADFNPNRVQVSVDENRRVIAVKIG